MEGEGREEGGGEGRGEGGGEGGGEGRGEGGREGGGEGRGEGGEEGRGGGGGGGEGGGEDRQWMSHNALCTLGHVSSIYGAVSLDLNTGSAESMSLTRLMLSHPGRNTRMAPS